jgi:hypothetical protein
MDPDPIIKRSIQYCAGSVKCFDEGKAKYFAGMNSACEEAFTPRE